MKLPESIKIRLIGTDKFIVTQEEYELLRAAKIDELDFTPFGFTVQNNDKLWIFFIHINYYKEKEYIRMKLPVDICKRNVDDVKTIQLYDLGILYTKTQGLRSLISDIMELNLNKSYLVTTAFKDPAHISDLMKFKLISKRTDYFNPSVGISKTYWYSNKLKDLQKKLIEIGMDFYVPRRFNSKYDKYIRLMEKYTKYALNNNMPVGKFHIRYSDIYNCYTGRYWTPLCSMGSSDRKLMGKIEYDVKCSINNLIYYNNFGELKESKDSSNLCDLYAELSSELNVDRESIKRSYQYTAFEKYENESLIYNDFRNEVIAQIGFNSSRTEIFIQESIIYFLATIIMRFKYNLGVDTVYDNFVFDSNSKITPELWISIIKECILNWDKDEFLDKIDKLIPEIDIIEVRWLPLLDVIDENEYKLILDYLNLKSKLLPIYVKDNYRKYVLKLNECGIDYLVKYLDKGIEFKEIILRIERSKRRDKFYRNDIDYDFTENYIKLSCKKLIGSKSYNINI